MSAMPPAAFCEKHPLWYRLIVLFIITAGVYLAFRYLLVIFIPFIIAYLIMRMLFPVIWFLRHRWRFPGWLAYGGTLTVFFGTVFGAVLVLIWQFWKQLKLFLQNFPVYRQEFLQLYDKQTGYLCGCFDRWMSLPAGSAQEYLSRWTSGVIAGSSAKLSEHAGNLLTFCFSGTGTVSDRDTDHCCEYDRALRGHAGSSPHLSQKLLLPGSASCGSHTQAVRACLSEIAGDHSDDHMDRM